MKEVKLSNFLHRYFISKISFLSQELQEILNINMPAKTASVKSGKLLDILVNYLYNYFELAGFEILNFTVTKYTLCTNHVQGTYFEHVFRKEKVSFFLSAVPSEKRLPQAKQLPTQSFKRINRKFSEHLDKSR